MPHRDQPRPPRFLALLARLLIHGQEGPYIREDLAESFARDLERGPRGRATRRYALNLLGSVGSVYVGALKGMVTRGAVLDAKLGVRMLGKQPLLTGVAMLALGLGIPAALSMVHVFRTLVSPLPVPEGERVLGIRNWDTEARDPAHGGIHDFALWKESLASFESIGAVRSYMVNLRTGDAGVPPVRATEISASSFDLLRIPPLLGRVFGAADEVRGAPDVALLSEDVWRARFAGDPEIVGEVVRINRKEHTVVGVMPASFRFPLDDDVWLPLRARAVDYPLGGGPDLEVFGRLAEGATRDEAQAEVQLVTRRMAADRPDVYARLVGQVVAMPLLILGEDDVDWSDPDLIGGQSIMFLFLLIVCGNVGTLILARTATRSAELSIRTALGASRARIVTQLFIEAVVLAVAATGCGLVAAEMVARWIMGLLATMGAGSIPYWMDLTLDPPIVLVALAVAVACGAVAGVIPAFKATGRAVQANLQRASAGNATIRFGLGSTLLIVSEVVLSVGFLAMGGTLVRGLFRDTEGQLGFAPERYLSAGLRLPWIDPAEDSVGADRAAFAVRFRETQEEVLTRLRTDGDVVGVGVTRSTPGLSGASNRIVLESDPPAGDADPPVVMRAYVDVDFFRGLHRPILSGRDFAAADVAEDADSTAVIVNSSFVAQILKGRSPIGQRFRVATPADTVPERFHWYEIVGVVGPFGMNGLNPSRDAGVYYPVTRGVDGAAGFVLEVRTDPSAFAPRLREIVAAVDPEVTLTGPRLIADAMKAERDLFRWAFTGQVILAGIAFLLSVSGLYALMSFTVTQRTREIGIRTALGARAWSVVSTIARRAAIQLGLGLALGVPWTWFLLGEVVSDPMVVDQSKARTIAVTLAVAAATGVVACLAPTLRGLRIQPTEALRES